MAALMWSGKATGLVWGIGATFVFPTASDPSLGKGKYQAGPTMMLFHLADKWNKGFFIQHWWSYAGHDNRADVIVTNSQYVLRKSFKRSSLDVDPNIKIDWVERFEKSLTLPFGLSNIKLYVWEIPQ